MYFKKAKPSDPLKKYINYYWVVKEDGYRTIREINPSSNICVFFHLGQMASYKLITKDLLGEEKQSVDAMLKKIEDAPPAAQNVIIGPHRTIMLETSLNNIYTFGIEFKTSIRKRFFGKDVISLTDSIIRLDNTNTKLSPLADIISQCKTDETFEIVDKYLIDNYLPIVSQKDEDKDLLTIINEVSTNPTDIDVEKMASKSHTCKRNFERNFKQHTGLTPKQFIVIQRINKVMDCMKGHKGNRLTEILEMCGYYDQTHINRDFQTIGGLPATQVFDNLRKQMTNSPDELCLNYENNGICRFNLLT